MRFLVIITNRPNIIQNNEKTSKVISLYPIVNISFK